MNPRTSFGIHYQVLIVKLEVFDQPRQEGIYFAMFHFQHLHLQKYAKLPCFSQERHQPASTTPGPHP